MAKVEQKTKVEPMILTIPDTGESYTLEFSRESIRFAEQRKFNIQELTLYPETNIPALFFYAFRKNHPNVARSKTDEILREYMGGGLSVEEIERLLQLYNEPISTLISTEEIKNRKATVSL